MNARSTEDAIDVDIVERLLFGDEDDSLDVGDVASLDETSLEDLLTLPSQAAKGVGPPKRKRTTQKQEIAYLKAKQRELHEQLHDLKQKITTQSSASAWEVRAKDQMQAAQRAMQENTTLRTILQDQLKTAQALERLLKKKPRIEMTPDAASEEWREWRLDADPARRRHAMHAITDHVYDKLESEFIQHGVYDLEDGQSGLTVRTQQNVLWFDYMQCLTWDIPYTMAQTLMWSMSLMNSAPEWSTSMKPTGEVLENWDDPHKMVYIGAHCNSFVQDQSFRTEGRWLFRLFVENDRTILVSRSILEDALHPHGDNEWRDNLLGWIVITTCPSNPNKTLVRYLHETTAPMPPPTLHAESTFQGLAQGELTECILALMRGHMQDIQHAMASRAFNEATAE
ncbi:Aste57867_11470 [Aphanomyces stellatus]|uniref:Aste57867_11470 protein n=1 Tax=Aphanomyces stellatus TaxID=120398 RepID=A0A485KTG8_9STRA|nr:hypothetical protein As57867_011427 [Aphanomyces stellatus]VFT88331.1 Aste57867_11470 [Aphanomyces stellatus]